MTKTILTFLVVLLSFRPLWAQYATSGWVTVSRPSTEPVKPNIIWQEQGKPLDTLEVVADKRQVAFSLVFPKPYALSPGQLQLLVKNQPLSARGAMRIDKKRPNEYLVTDLLDVPHGLSSVRLVFTHKNEPTLSEPRLFRRVPPDLYLFTAGVKSKLRFTANDANDMDTLFRAQQKAFYRQVISAGPYVSEEQTKGTSLQEALTLFVNQYKGVIRPQNDLIILVLSGHGNRVTSDEGEDFVLQGSDFRLELAKSRSLHYTEHILRELSQIDCKKLILLDACHSEPPNLLAQGTKADYLTDLAQAYAAFSKAPARTITLVSSSKNQYSYEHPNWQNGAFVATIKQGLKQGQADVNKDGFVTVQELFQYIQKEVPQKVSVLYGQAQEPLLIPKNFPDFPIYRWR